jgi:tetratricopeptide (TPR) repeat protein
MVPGMIKSAPAALFALALAGALHGCSGAPSAAGPGASQTAPDAAARQAKLLLSKAEGYFFNGRFPEAIAGYTEVLAAEPAQAVAFRCRAAAHAALGHDTEALADYGRAVAIDPRYDDAWVGRGLYLYSKGRYADAIDDFARALSIDRRNGTANLYKALACEQVGRLREAAEARSAYIHCEIPREGGGGDDSGAPARELAVLRLKR